MRVKKYIRSHSYLAVFFRRLEVFFIQLLNGCRFQNRKCTQRGKYRGIKSENRKKNRKDCDPKQPRGPPTQNLPKISAFDYFQLKKKKNQRGRHIIEKLRDTSSCRCLNFL